MCQHVYDGSKGMILESKNSAVNIISLANNEGILALTFVLL